MGHALWYNYLMICQMTSCNSQIWGCDDNASESFTLLLYVKIILPKRKDSSYNFQVPTRSNCKTKTKHSRTSSTAVTKHLVCVIIRRVWAPQASRVGPGTSVVPFAAIHKRKHAAIAICWTCFTRTCEGNTAENTCHQNTSTTADKMNYADLAEGEILALFLRAATKESALNLHM